MFEMQLMEQANIESAETCPAFEMEVEWLPYGGGGASSGGVSDGGRSGVGEKGRGEWKVDIRIPEREMFKYKKVANRTKPVATTLPEEYRIKRYPIEDPLADLPELPVDPPDFTPGKRYTQER